MKNSPRSFASRIVHESLTGLTLVAVLASSSFAHADSAVLAAALSSARDADLRDDGAWSLDPTRGAAVSVPSAVLSSALGGATVLRAVTETIAGKSDVSEPGPGAARAEVDDGAGLRVAGYMAGGVGIAGLALFVVGGLGAKNAFDKLDTDCGTTPCNDVDHRSTIEEGRMLQTAANIGLATGIVGLGLGATFIVLGRRPLEDKPNEKSAPVVSVVGAPSAISVRGSF